MENYQMRKTTTIYLTNRELLKEIHNSKVKFSSFLKPEYASYDAIVSSLDEINIRTIAEARRERATKLEEIEYEKQIKNGVKPSSVVIDVDWRTIPKDDLIFRVMTFDHIPNDPGRKRRIKTVADSKARVNFPPFQHVKFENGKIVCVGKSHWKGDLETGSFSIDHGCMTNRLAMMILKLCERYATKGNVRSYTYNDEMRGQAALQLTQVCLQFDESKSSNPFSWMTACVTNSFVRIINVEKRHQEIRDDILEINGMCPSWTRQNSSPKPRKPQQTSIDIDE